MSRIKTGSIGTPIPLMMKGIHSVPLIEIWTRMGNGDTNKRSDPGQRLADFVGSCVVNSVKMNGHFHFHYDEALNILSTTSYVAATWNEVDPN